MTRLWRNNPETPEGKYPIVLRRDGTPVEKPYFVILASDPAATEALLAYADAAETIGFDQSMVNDVREMAHRFKEWRKAHGSGDPDASPHRKDNPIVIAWSRSIGAPSA